MSTVVPNPHVLRDYAFLGDGERGVMMGPDGDIAWLCFPYWDSPSIFSTLLGAPGEYRITPTERFVTGGYYEAGSLIWHSRWVTNDAEIECREALAYPGSMHEAIVLRQVQGHRSAAPVRVTLDPHAEYGSKGVRSWHQDDNGAWTAHVGEVFLRWTGAPGATQEPDGHGGHRLVCEVVVAEGETYDFVLELSDHPFEHEPTDAASLWRRTETAWDDAMPDFHKLQGSHDVERSYAVLRGMTSSSGAMVAAASTCLPERANQGRSYDYRYAWIRDQCLVGQAVAKLGSTPLLHESTRFVSERLLADGANLRPAYTVRGEPIPGPRKINVPGYPGGDSMIGNQVNDQFQLDMFGNALSLFAEADRMGQLDADGWRAAQIAADAIAERWNEPDAGVWELENRHWTHSRLMCVSGLRSIGARPAANHNAGKWLALADEIMAETSRTSTHESGRWQRAPDDERVDAALLMPALAGGVPLADPRTVATVKAVERELMYDGYVYRYRIDERPLGEAEGAFLLCGFWAALACGQQGNHVDAARYFERNRSAAGSPGILAEEYDIQEAQLRGNFPQAFVHALLLQTAVDQSQWDDSVSV